MTMDKKIIAIAGATGAQGGGLARAILNDSNSEFAVRALTRNASSDKAKALAEMGAEVVEADVANSDSINNAFKGAYGAFCVTFFWEHFSPEMEVEHARIFAEAAKANDLKHVIWSTLEDTRVKISDDESFPTLMGKYKVPHFDAKGEANHFFKDLGVPTTYLNTAFYWDNFIYFGMGPQKGPDGNYYITFPMGDKLLPGMAAEDIGKCAYGIFKKGDELIGHEVGIAGEHLTGEEMAAKIASAMDMNVGYNAVEPEIYRGFGFPGAEDLGSMFQYKRDFNEDFVAHRSLDFSKSINPELQDFATWLSNNKDRIPIE